MKKKYVLVTGATGGLGEAFSIDCARRGYDLIMTDTKLEKLNQFAQKLMNQWSVRVETFDCDFRNFDERNALFSWLDERLFEVFLTINVAGLDFEGEIETITSHDISAVMRVNTESTLDITRYICAKEHDDNFYIINVASMAGFYSMPLKAMYAASKRAIIQFSLAIREEIKNRGGHITVLCPAGLRTTKITTAKIESQGFAGKITTIDHHVVARKTINKVYQNKAIYIPGIVNKVIVMISNLIPDTVKAKFIYRRWSLTRKKEKLV